MLQYHAEQGLDGTGARARTHTYIHTVLGRVGTPSCHSLFTHAHSLTHSHTRTHAHTGIKETWDAFLPLSKPQKVLTGFPNTSLAARAPLCC